MKLMKIAAIATMITAIIMLSCAVAMSAEAEAPSELYYGKLVAVTGVTKLESNLWVIECQDKDGQGWAFLNEEKLHEGDILNLLMYRLNENEEDDKCMDYTYEGHSQNVEEFFEIIGWR